MMEKPVGFSLCQYLYNVKHAVEEAFLVKSDGSGILKKVEFSPIHDFQFKDIDVPACILDMYSLKVDPSFDEFQHKGDTEKSNLGTLALYMYMRALVLVSNRRERSHFDVRQYALDLGGIVTDARRFESRVGFSQITTIEETREVQDRNNSLLGWTVEWQHTVELEAPAYESRLINFPDVDMKDIYSSDDMMTPEDATVTVDEEIV